MRDKYGWWIPEEPPKGLHKKRRPSYEQLENEIAELEKALGRKHVQGEARYDEGATENAIFGRAKYLSALRREAKRKGMDISRIRPAFGGPDSFYRAATDPGGPAGPTIGDTEAEYSPRRPKGKKKPPPDPVPPEIQYELAKVGRDGIYDDQDRETKRRELRKSYMDGYPVNEQVRSRDRRIAKLGGVMPSVWGAFGMPGMSQIAANIDANIADSDREYERRYDLADRKRKLLQEGFSADENFADYKDRMSRDSFKVGGKVVDPDLAALLPEGRMQAASQEAEKLHPVLGEIVSRRMSIAAGAPEIKQAMQMSQLRSQQNAEKVKMLELALREGRFASEQEQQMAMNELRKSKLELQRDEYELAKARLEEQKAARAAKQETGLDPAKKLLESKPAFDEWAAEAGGYNPYTEEASKRGYIEPVGNSPADLAMKLGLRIGRRIME